MITVEPLNVRAGPGNEYPSYGKIPAGVPLQETGETNGWLSVHMTALPGGIGWISGNYGSPTPEQSQQRTSDPVSSQGR